MSDRLRELAGRAPGAGRLEGACAHGRAEHPVCGDELEVDVRIEAGLVAAVAWRARGCPATMAVAACLADAWVGGTPADAGARLRRRIADLGGLQPHEGHAEKMAARALTDALAGSRP